MTKQSTTFLRRIILLFGNISWSAEAPELAGPDYCLWYLKYKIHAAYTHCAQDLEIHITEGTGAVNGALLQRLVQNFIQ
jgi:hypothetical protein